MFIHVGKKEGKEIKMKKEKRICNVCKKPMFNSLAGEWINKKFVNIHEKCKKKEKFKTWRLICSDGTESLMTYDPIKHERDKLKEFKDKEKKIKELHGFVVNGLVNGLSWTSRDERLDDIDFWAKRCNLFNEFSKCVLDIVTDQDPKYAEKNLKEIAKEGYKKIS